MTIIRDFIYLDLPRLQSFASQLLEGLPEDETKTTGREADFAGEVRAGLPGLLGASANTKAVMSAASSVRSTVHHRLVGLVVDELERQGFLDDKFAKAEATDGQFVLLHGQLQITDPTAFSNLFDDWRQLEANAAILQAGPAAEPERASRADRRAGRLTPKPSFSKSYLEAITGVVQRFAENSVRVRVMSGGTTAGVCVAEREKFVEDLTRLTTRHGYLMTGDWDVLGQINLSTAVEQFSVEGEGRILDLVESAGLSVLTTFNELSGAATSAGSTTVTPLAIYRIVTGGR